MDKQELVDILVACTMQVHSHRWFDNRTCDEVGDYIRRTLDKFGVKSIQAGSSHVVLVDG